jgi:acetyltransferase-like isoleucine patch superfamily enzyme
MTGFISQKAEVKGYVDNNSVILGNSVIGPGTLIDMGVMIGYLIEKKFKSLLPLSSFDLKKIDSLSKGAVVGSNCIIRSGSVVYETAIIGNDVRTGHNVLIREGSIIGEKTLIGSSTILDGAVNIGRGVNIQSNVYLPNLTVIEDEVFIAPNVCFSNDRYPQSKSLNGVIVEKNAIVCANATLVAGIRIGENAVVGAGAVVTKDVKPNSVVIGNAAHFYINREEYDEKKRVFEESF